MNRTTAALLAAIALVVLSATPAGAATETVNAAENAVRWDSSDTCGVIVDDYIDMEVNLYCFGDGRAWVTVRVPDVTGDVTRVTAGGTGDCTGKDLSFRKRGETVTVKILHSGEFDCTYKRVTVRHTG